MRSVRFTIKPTYRVDEVAEFACVHRRTVLRQIHRGVLPAFKFGTNWRVQAADLAEYVKKNGQRCTPRYNADTLP